MREITCKHAIKILDNAIERCRNILSKLEEDTEGYENTFGEMRMYQMHKETLLKGGVIDE